MKKIKPVVKGYSRVYASEIRSPAIFSVKYLKSTLGRKCGNMSICIHPNGKPKFRPVYDYTVSHEVES